MPISPEMMARYPGGSIRSKEWKELVARIRERSGNKCEQCKVPNGELICRGDGQFAGTYMTEDGYVFDAETGEAKGRARGSEYTGTHVLITLTVAHLNHDPKDCADDNLRHWCQMHHNRYDAKHRAGNAAFTRAEKVGQSDFFGRSAEQSGG